MSPDLAVWPPTRLDAIASRSNPAAAGLRRAVEKPLSAFQPGSAWTASGTGSQLFDSDCIVGAQSLRITPSTDLTDQVTTKSGMPATDLNTSYLRLMVKLGGTLKYLKVRIASGAIATDFAEAVIFDNGSVNAPGWIATGVWNHTWVPREMFTVTGVVDFTQITSIQLRAAVTGAGTVNCKVNRITSVAKPAGSAVSVTFDDGLAPAYTIGLPKLSEYAFPATAYIIANQIDTANDVRGLMTTAQLQDLQATHGWEIGSHAYDIANHNLPNGFNDLTPAQAEADFQAMRKWLLDRELDGGDQFAWPLGKHNAANEAIAAGYFSAAVSTHGVANVYSEAIFPHPMDRLHMRRFVVDGTVHTPTDLLTAVDAAIARKEHLIVAFHNLTTGAAVAATDFSKANFATFIDGLAVKATSVRVVGDVLRYGP